MYTILHFKRKNFNHKIILVISAFLFLILSSCFTAQSHGNYLRSELANQGPLVLSRENPFLATNLLVIKEAEKSATLKGFVEHRGWPTAIEVKRSMLSRDEIYFFYLEQNEVYLLQNVGADWVVQGPIPIPQDVLVSLSKQKVTTQTATTANAASSPRGSLMMSDILPEAYQNQQQAEQQTKSSLPEADYDLTHRVRFPGETLRMISQWYTGSFRNADRIARINGLEDPNLLSLGQEVRIPGYLLTKRGALNEQFVNEWIRTH